MRPVMLIACLGGLVMANNRVAVQPANSIRGSYVEARTASVFRGVPL